MLVQERMLFAPWRIRNLKYLEMKIEEWLNFWVPPSWLKINFKSIVCLFFGVKAILGHEGGTQKFRVVAQNKAIQIRFQIIEEKKFL